MFRKTAQLHTEHTRVPFDFPQDKFARDHDQYFYSPSQTIYPAILLLHSPLKEGKNIESHLLKLCKAFSNSKQVIEAIFYFCSLLKIW